MMTRNLTESRTVSISMIAPCRLPEVRGTNNSDQENDQSQEWRTMVVHTPTARRRCATDRFH